MYQVLQQYLEDIGFQINCMKQKLFNFKSSFDVEYEQVHFKFEMKGLRRYR